MHLDGTSVNVVDGITRVEGLREQSDAPLPVVVDLGPVAHYLPQGHAIRVQISSGAHPVFARNQGSTEPLATATRLYSAEQRIYLGDAHASRISVNVLDSELNPAQGLTLVLPSRLVCVRCGLARCIRP